MYHDMTAVFCPSIHPPPLNRPTETPSSSAHVPPALPQVLQHALLQVPARPVLELPPQRRLLHQGDRGGVRVEHLVLQEADAGHGDPPHAPADLLEGGWGC